MIEHLQFVGFPPIRRLSRTMVVTEKIDGTNAQILITEDGRIQAGSRNRWITPEDDNFGFARWVAENETELLRLGPGQHFGEWWGIGIQRRYGLDHKRFSLFNAHRWSDERGERPDICHVVPTLGIGEFSTSYIAGILDDLADKGSVAAPGFMNPEGVVVYHARSKTLFKKTLGGDGAKGSK